MSDDDHEMTWIEWFCRLKGNEFFVEVDEDYAQDDFNLTGLSQVVPYYDDALNIILDEDDQDHLGDDESALLETATQMLYGLIHARFLQTNRGIQALYEKYSSGVYGVCWNEHCEREKRYVLPIGSDIVGQSHVNVYCPSCGECYVPRSSKLQVSEARLRISSPYSMQTVWRLDRHLRICLSSMGSDFSQGSVI
jgi:casein kinase II subunit beta